MAKVEIKMGEIGGGGKVAKLLDDTLSLNYNVAYDTNIPSAKVAVVWVQINTTGNAIVLYSVIDGVVNRDFVSSGYETAGVDIDVSSATLQLTQKWYASGVRNTRVIVYGAE